MQEQLKKFKEMVSSREERDFTYFHDLLSSSELSQILYFISANWSMYAPFYEGPLEQFQDLIKGKIQQIQKYQQMFPMLPKIIRQLQLVNEYVGDGGHIVSQKPLMTDKIYKNVLDKFRQKDYSGAFYVKVQEKGRVLLSQFIANCEDYLKSDKLQARWQDIFNRIDGLSQLRNQRGQQISAQSFQFIGQIQKERILPLDCLGCCQFFYFGSNIYNPAINSTPIVLLQAVSRVRQLQSQLKDEICWLLNEHGGVILFDCLQTNRNIIPRGEQMSLQLQAEVDQAITSFIQCIHPHVERANFSISFVPIIKSPLRNQTRKGKKVIMDGSTYQSTYYEREFLEGFYVTRIKINPTVPQRIYFWVNDRKPIFPVKDKLSKKIVAASGRSISKIIKKRFKLFYVAETARNSEEMKFLSPKLSYFHPGECLKPDLGLQVKASSTKNNSLVPSQQRFQHISLILAKKTDLGEIQKRLRYRDIDCEIKDMFQAYKCKYTYNSAVIYHNMRFDLLLKQIQYKKQYEFDGKYTGLLFVTSFVLLVNRNAYDPFPEDYYHIVLNWFNKEFPRQPLWLWRYETNQHQSEFYFRTSSRIQNIFIYYILSRLGEKNWIRNPKNLDKLSNEDINRRFKLIYPRKPKKEEHQQEQRLLKYTLKEILP